MIDERLLCHFPVCPQDDQGQLPLFPILITDMILPWAFDDTMLPSSLTVHLTALRFMRPFLVNKASL